MLQLKHILDMFPSLEILLGVLFEQALHTLRNTCALLHRDAPLIWFWPPCEVYVGVQAAAESNVAVPFFHQVPNYPCLCFVAFVRQVLC